MSPAVLELLRGAMANSVRILACEDFFYSIGAVRFSRSQSLLTMYDRLFLQAPSVLKRALFALQACVLFGLGDEMLAHAFTVLAQNVRVRVDDSGEEAAVGIHLMLSYFVMLLLSLCYDRGYVVHTLKVGAEEVCDAQDAIYNDVLLALLSVEDQTAEKVIRNAAYVRENTDCFMEVLTRVADSHFDTDAMEKVYRLKKEYLDDVCVFLGNDELMDITKRIEVPVLCRAYG